VAMLMATDSPKRIKGVDYPAVAGQVPWAGHGKNSGKND
jgi:hypothetical protein